MEAVSLILQTEANQPWGTPGQYLIDGLGYLKTLEPVNVGFPAGDYILQIYFSPEHGYFVPRFISPTDPKFADRCIENHPGNICYDTHNCVLVGDGYGNIDCAAAYNKIDPKTGKMDPRHYLGTVRGLTNSGVTFQHLMHDGKIDFGKPVYKDGVIIGYVGGTDIQVIRAVV